MSASITVVAAPIAIQSEPRLRTIPRTSAATDSGGPPDRGETRRIERRYGEAAAAIREMSLNEGRPRSSLMRAWVSHPDERIPVLTATLRLLDEDGMSALAERALDDADADGMWWTPLLDAVDWERLLCSDQTLYLSAETLLEKVAAQLRCARDRTGRLVQTLLAFRNPEIDALIVANAPALSRSQILTLAERGSALHLMSSAHNSATCQGVIAAWAVDELFVAIRTSVAPYTYMRPCIALNELRERCGFVPQLIDAAQLALEFAEATPDDPVRARCRQMLYDVLCGALQGASPSEILAFGVEGLDALLSCEHAGVQREARRAVTRARRNGVPRAKRAMRA